RLKIGSSVKDTISMGSGPPTLALNQSLAGAVFQGLKQINWTSTDPSNKKLTFSIFYSPDDNKTWFPVAGKLVNKSLVIDSSSLDASTNARLRIIASNGFNKTQIDSGLFSVVKTPPRVNILSPVNGDEFFGNSTIPFKGTAFDGNGIEIPDNQTYWETDGVQFSSGKENEAILPIGSHQITFGAFDSENVTTEATITIKVNPDEEEVAPEQITVTQTVTTDFPGVLLIGGILAALSARNFRKRVKET
ncbi:MAG TPA: hypothetical protein VJ044_04885, partial [Candidatus Hodarchaeales archaeon]|nr:hypothetical protein [Candidatus Hodarchaeales archaeon]